jgi:hypothetical protein
VRFDMLLHALAINVETSWIRQQRLEREALAAA